MRPFKRLKQRRKSRAFKMLLAPAFKKFKPTVTLESRGERPLQMTFEDQLKALVFLHLEEFSSGRELLQAFTLEWGRGAHHRSHGCAKTKDED